MNTFDFSRSYLRFRIEPAVQAPITVTGTMPTLVNNVRINLECRCELVHLQTGRRHTYILGASCKTERVGVERDCWMEPNADFCVVASEEEFLVIKSWAQNNMPIANGSHRRGKLLERQSGCCRDAWTNFDYKLRPVRGQSLESLDQIIGAIQGDRSIISRTEYIDDDWSVVIEHPVKTINYSKEDRIYQTDTGPILLPDLSPERLQRGARLVDCFDLAYSAFNSTGWVEFIVNVPTPVAEGVSVSHYSRPRRIERVRNSLIEVLEESAVPQRNASVGERMLRADDAEIPQTINGTTGGVMSGISAREVQPAR